MATEIFRLVGTIAIETGEAKNDLNQIEQSLGEVVKKMNSLDTTATDTNATLSSMHTVLGQIAEELVTMNGRADITDDALTDIGTEARTANGHLGILSNVVDEINGRLATLDTRAATAETELSEIGTEASTANTWLESLDTTLSAINTALSTLNTRAEAAETGISEIGTEATTANTHLDSLETVLGEINSALSTLDDRAEAVESEISGIGTEASTTNGHLETLEGNITEMLTVLGSLDSRATDAVNAIRNLGSNADITGNQLNQNGFLHAGAVFIGNVLEDLAYRAVDLGWEFLQLGITFNSSAESYKAMFKTMLGVTDTESDAIYDKIRQFAVDTPYSMEGIAKSATRLFNAGYNVDETLDILETFGNIANGDSNKMQRIIKAWTDTKGYGRLRAQERNQFTENGVMIDQLLADYYNSIGKSVSVDDIVPLMENKAISDHDVMMALIMAQEEGGNYYRAMANIMDTYGGQMEKAGDQLEETAGMFTLPIFETLKNETLPEATAILEEFKTWSEDNQGIIQEIAEALSGLAIGALETLTNFFTFCMENYEDISYALGAILGAIAVTAAINHPILAALAALATFIGQSEEAREIFTELLTLFGDLFEQYVIAPINDAIAVLEEFLRLLGFDVDLPRLGEGEGAEQYDTVGNAAHETVENMLVEQNSPDKPAGQYWYVPKASVDVLEALWDMERGGLTATDVSSYNAMIEQTKALFSDIAESFGTEYSDDTFYSWLAGLVGEMNKLDKSMDDLPEDWFHVPYGFEPPSNFVPAGSSGAGGNNYNNGHVVAAIKEIPTMIRNGIADGLSGVTITGVVNQGNVQMDGSKVGALVGSYVNFRLGRMLQASDRG